ncbi:MAG TPA: glycerol kinase GlpK [Candidatus Dormibacteraeota bacterium]|nr:glycerol kinase GlpK [Candidatus Dormibacteraeota bacterium]
MADIVLALDEGTTGATAVAVGLGGDVRGKGYREITQHFPKPGWVEHDAEEIWGAVQETAAQALAAAGARPADVRAVGITNQRETLVVWDRRTLKPLGRAIVWQDRRTTEECIRLRDAGYEDKVREVTGLVLDPYFTATKAGWAVKHVHGAREAAFGTVDSWLVARLSGGADHVTDASNASRTLLFDIRSGRWSEEMADLFGVPLANMPEVRDSSGHISRTTPDAFGGVDAPITGIAGDQQSALFGQACTAVGMAKNTYGTGSFVLVNTGGDRVMSKTGMLTTVAWGRGGALTYALEGAIFVTGAALQWLRDGLGIIGSAAEAGPLAESVPDAGGVYLVPAFVGLGAPHWDPYARGTIVGLTRGSGRAHIVRAAVEAMAFQTRDVVEAMEKDSGHPLQELRVDGGAAVMDVLCQLQADLLGIPVRRPRLTETTALGAAYLAGVGAGLWRESDLADLWKLDREFTPRMSRDEADAMQDAWRRAVDRSRGWLGGDNQRP